MLLDLEEGTWRRGPGPLGRRPVQYAQPQARQGTLFQGIAIYMVGQTFSLNGQIVNNSAFSGYGLCVAFGPGEETAKDNI